MATEELQKRFHTAPEVTFFVESREEAASADSRGQFLLDRLGGGDVITALTEIRGRVAVALNLHEIETDDALINFLREFSICGIPIDIWPNLEDRDGYWIHRGNVRKACAEIPEIIDRLAKKNVDFENVGLDFEFPIEILKGGFQLREYLRQKPWRFSEDDSRVYIADLIARILRDTPYGVRSYEVPILGDEGTNAARVARKFLGMVQPPEQPHSVTLMVAPERFKRVGLVYTSVKPRFIGGPPEEFVRNYSASFSRVPALGIVSATGENPGRSISSKPPRFLNEAELQRDVRAALKVSPREFYVFALNGLPVIEWTRAAIEAALNCEPSQPLGERSGR